MALILLVLGGLLVGTSVSLMHTNLKANIMVDRKTSELYAADAGVEDAVWNLQYGTEPAGGWGTWSDQIGNINDRTVDISISDEGGGNYKITSTAGGTTIECNISLLDFSWLFDSAITCPTEGGVTLKPGTEVDPPDSITCPLEEGQIWPEANDLSGFYSEQVEGFTFAYSSIDIKDTKSIGPLYRDGSLDIDNTGDPDTLQLTGTIYVTGDLTFEQAGQSHAYTLDLNGQTIYVKGNISTPSNRFNVTGSGCLIAEGDITFQPATTSGPDDFVFIMSIDGTSTIQPGGTFYGSVAGDAEVYLAPGTSLTWPGEPEDGLLNFPGGDSGSSGPLKILTYTIDPS